MGVTILHNIYMYFPSQTVCDLVRNKLQPPLPTHGEESTQDMNIRCQKGAPCRSCPKEKGKNVRWRRKRELRREKERDRDRSCKKIAQKHWFFLDI